MATKEDQETLRLLVQYVSRAFYEPKYTIIMDQLARHPVLKDDDLAGRMGLQPKELNKIIAVLSNDCLVKVYRQNELKEGAQRSVGKQYYYIDYQHFCNVVKWRIAKMRNIIDSGLRNELDNRGYICTQCKQAYTPLEVDKLMDFMRGIMVCEICHAEVVDNENAESVQGSKDRMQRFNHQIKFIREGLQKSESMVLPAFDVATWVKNHLAENEKQKSAQQQGGLKVAGSDPNKRMEDQGIGIMMAMDKDENMQRREREAEAELKRQQNALPAWHLKSTITGDLTALGVREKGREEAAAAMASVAAGSNDDILKGLGVIGSGYGQGQGHGEGQNGVLKVEQQVSRLHVLEEKADQDDGDYYDQYYASLAASTTVSAHPTPTPTLQGSVSEFGSGSELNIGIDLDEEEDRKPDVEYLDSLNDYRKRSRSREDDGSGAGAKVTKMVRLESGTAVGGTINSANGHTNVKVEVNVYNAAMEVNSAASIGEAMGGGSNGYEDLGSYGEEYGGEYVPREPEDDPIVYVNGNPKPYSQVTEEDHEMMTPDEYTMYFEIMQARL